MTERYTQGFITKCAEYGVDTNDAIELLKEAAKIPNVYSQIFNRTLSKPSFGYVRKEMMQQINRALSKSNPNWSRELHGPEGKRMLRAILGNVGVDDGKWARRAIRDAYKMDTNPAYMYQSWLERTGKRIPVRSSSSLAGMGAAPSDMERKLDTLWGSFR